MSPPEPPGFLPPQVESAWRAIAERATGLSGEEALERLRPSVARLSDLFTLDRPASGFPDYLADESLLAAYGLFFFPQSWARAGWALAHARFRGWAPSSSRPRILDIGSGPGSCGLKLARSLGGEGDLRLLDQSPSALAAAEALISTAAPGWTAIGTVGDARNPDSWPEGPFDIVVAGFVLNELGLDEAGCDTWFEAAAAHLTPGGLLILIEPALRATAEPLRRLADRRAALSPRRIGPEVDLSPCPMLGGEHWDHEVRDWEAPPLTAFLNRKLHRNLSAVRFSLALFSDAALAPIDANAARIVAEPQLLKGLFRLVVSAGGRLRTVEVATRGLGKREAKDLAAGFARGDVVRVPPGESRRVDAASLVRLGP